MEALISRRLCRVCLGQLLKNRHSSVQAYSVLLHKPVSGMTVGRVGRYSKQLREGTSYRWYSDQEQSDGKQGKTNIMEDMKAQPKAKEGGGIPWKFIGAGCMFVVVYGLIRSLKSKAEKELLETQTVPLVKLSVGGAWELVSQDGQVMTNKDFFGQWVLMYFGFTHCPDICPDELEKLVKAVNIIDNNRSIPNVKPLFVTIDEERDTKEVIKSYLAEFSPKLLGFAGTTEQINSIKKAYRVYSSKGPVDADGDYIVDHSIITYLVNPDGDTVMYFGRDKDMLEVARSIEKAMLMYKKLKT